MFEIESTNIKGCKIIKPTVYTDKRGCFVKTFHHEIFEDSGFGTDFKEEYYTISNKNVLRGLHFQLPPHDHVKLVYCMIGKVMDVIVDLRNGSQTYGEYQVFELSDRNKLMIYIPKGLAHGFCTLGDTATLVYKTTSVYDHACDSGIRWDSVGIPWPKCEYILSDRDQCFPTLAEFDSPFVFEREVSDGVTG